MTIKRPQTMEAYIDLVDQAVFEAADLRAAIEYDSEYMEGIDGFVTELENELKALLESLKDGSYSFSEEDLPFMSLVNSVNDVLLPFKYLLKQINHTHTAGLDNS